VLNHRPRLVCYLTKNNDSRINGDIKMIKRVLTIVLLATMTGCDRQKVARPNECAYDNQSIASIMQAGKCSVVHSIVRKIPWESVEPDMSFAKVTQTGNDLYSISLYASEWKPSGSHGIEAVIPDTYKSHIAIYTNVDARAYLETYIGCDLTFYGVVSLDQVRVNDTTSIFRLVQLGFIYESAGRLIPNVDVDTFILTRDARFSSTQISSSFSFPSETILSDFRSILYDQCKQYMGICKQVELLAQGTGEKTP